MDYHFIFGVDISNGNDVDVVWYDLWRDARGEEGGAGVARGDQEEGETVIDLPRDVISSPANDKYINTIIRSQTVLQDVR